MEYFVQTARGYFGLNSEAANGFKVQGKLSDAGCRFAIITHGAFKKGYIFIKGVLVVRLPKTD